MQYKLFIYLIVALVLGVFSSFAVKKAMFTEEVKRPVVRKGPVVNVLVAKTDLMAGSEFTAQNIRFDSVPESIIPRDAIFSTDGILHRKAAGDIPKDAVITLFDIKMPQKGENEEAVSFIPPGYSVVPIQIDSISTTESSGDISDYLKLDEVIKVGDKVELSVVHREGSNNSGAGKRGVLPKLVVNTIIPSADVYKVFTELRTSDNSMIPHRFSILSLLLDENEIKQVKKAVSTGRIRVSILQKEKNFPNDQPLLPVLMQNPVASQKPSNAGNVNTPVNTTVDMKSTGNDSFVFNLDVFKKKSSEKETPIKNNKDQAPIIAGAAVAVPGPTISVKDVEKTPVKIVKSEIGEKKIEPIKKNQPKSSLILSEQNPPASLSGDKEESHKNENESPFPSKSVNSPGDRSMIDPQLLLGNNKETNLAGKDLPGIAYSQDFTEVKDLKKIPVVQQGRDSLSKATIAETSPSRFRYRPGYATSGAAKLEIPKP